MIAPERMELITGHAFEAQVGDRLFTMVVLAESHGEPFQRMFGLWVGGEPAAAGYIRVEGRSLVMDFNEHEAGYNDMGLHAPARDQAKAVDLLTLQLEQVLVHGWK